MPELPEVETVVRQLKSVLPGRRVRKLDIIDKKLLTDEVKQFTAQLNGQRCIDVSRIGKLAVIHFDRSLWLAVHLRMTGRLLWHEESDTANGLRPRAILHLDHGDLFFQDTRRFGIIRLVSQESELACRGIDPLSRRFSTSSLKTLLAGCQQEIKVWLMRQDRLTGIGNIYASEILFDCGIHPRRSVCDVTDDETDALGRSTRHVLQRAIRYCGVTFSDFQDSKGRNGSYQKYLQVYGKEGQHCARCGSPIERIVQQQRSTFFCPQCQR